MQNTFVRNLLIEQRRRAVGALMGYIERPETGLTSRQQQGLREHVLATLNSYHDVCLDILKSSVTDGSIQNEEAVRLITEMHATLTGRRGT